MAKREKKERKIYIPTFGEEVGNTISHGVMTLLTLCALPFAAVYSWIHSHGSVQAVVGTSIFCISILMMTLISTLYHAMQHNSRHKHIFHILDHIFIYVAIAGSYTPVALEVIGGWQGILIVIIQWAMVLFGIFYKSLSNKSIPAISLTIYLIMGWTIVFFFPLFLKNASIPFISLIGAGGLLYTIGAIFYAKKGFKHHHLVWHLFINFAAICHYIAIVFFI